MAKFIRARTRKKRSPKKRGLIQTLNHALHENDPCFYAKQGAGKIGIMMMLRAKRLRKWLQWLKRRRLRLKRRLRNLEALEKLLQEEMALAKECGMAFQWITDPEKKQAADSAQDDRLNAQEISALLASFSKSTAKQLADPKNPHNPTDAPLLEKGVKRQQPHAKGSG